MHEASGHRSDPEQKRSTLANHARSVCKFDAQLNEQFRPNRGFLQGDFNTRCSCYMLESAPIHSMPKTFGFASHSPSCVSVKSRTVSPRRSGRGRCYFAFGSASHSPSCASLRSSTTSPRRSGPRVSRRAAREACSGSVSGRFSLRSNWC